MIPITFQDAVRALGRNASVRVANGVRPPARYLFQTLLPDRPSRTYHTQDANLTVRTTIAGPTAMDAPYFPVGAIQGATWSEGTIKGTARFELTEENRRAIREMLENLLLQGLQMGASPGGIVGSQQTAMENEILNIENKLIQQALWDFRELCRAKALVTGAISIVSGDKTVSVSYGIPSGNILATETGNDAWDGSSSDFWDNIASLQSLLKYDVLAYIAHPTTITKIIGNSVNNLVIANQTQPGAWLFGQPVELQRMDTNNGFRVEYPDKRFNITLIPYAEEYEILDTANPGRTTKVPFMPTGKILAVGVNRASGYRVGQGATEDPNAALPLGYTHVGPTEEANGMPGDWLNTYVPEDMPMQINFRGACNFLPVIQNPDKIAIASSDLS